jgi:hypothetical protein
MGVAPIFGLANRDDPAIIFDHCRNVSLNIGMFRLTFLWQASEIPPHYSSFLASRRNSVVRRRVEELFVWAVIFEGQQARNLVCSRS